MDAYTARRPDVAAKMAELTQARRDVQVSLGRAFIFIVDKPREIGSLSDTQIRALASQQTEPARPKPDFFASFGDSGPTQILLKR